MSLEDLARKYGCDKLSAHGYVPFYEELFRGRTVKRLLEIGIGYRELMKPFVPHYVHGASLRMWNDFFPDAEIFACDIRQDTLINEGRIHSWVCDQSKVASLLSLAQTVGDNLDVIIDDGSHNRDDQIVTAIVLKYSLAPGGVYIVEDVQEPERVATAIGGTIHRFDKRPDDCLVIWHKP